jgi:hypothetical protein
MANTTPARYTKQLGIMATPETGGEVMTWAAKRGVSASTVARELLEIGLKQARDAWREQYGDIDPERLSDEIAKAQQQGAKQVTRRREYDSTTRSTGLTAAEVRASAGQTTAEVVASATKRIQDRAAAKSSEAPISQS